MTSGGETQLGSATIGRRARNKQDKQERIFHAAAALFAAHGYSSVTTQMIADRADVGTGTLFRYASSKAELLLMVINEGMRRDTRRGAAAASVGASPTEAIMALLQPLIDVNLAYPENSAVYQREILFGSEQGRYRIEALARITELEEAIGDILRRLGRTRRVRDGADLEGAARTIFSTLYLELIRVSLGREHAEALPVRLRGHVDALLYGVLLPP